MDFSSVVIQEDAPEDGETTQITGDGSSPKALPTIWSEVGNQNVCIFLLIRLI